MRQRLTNRLQFNLNYTWSATRGNDDGDNPLGSVNANVINKDCCDIASGNMQFLNPAAFQAIPLNSVSR